MFSWHLEKDALAKLEVKDERMVHYLVDAYRQALQKRMLISICDIPPTA